jgi:hypothetical protein
MQRDQIHTIQDALSFISHPQSVQMTHPARPGIVVDASQQILIEALPPILVLHVKRFCYDKEVGGVVKVGKQIAFGPELDIGSGKTLRFFFPDNGSCGICALQTSWRRLRAGRYGISSSVVRLSILLSLFLL